MELRAVPLSGCEVYTFTSPWKLADVALLPPTPTVYLVHCNSYDGQEAVMTGIEFALTKEDAVITSYRDHCQHLSRGGTVKQVMAELMGKRDGASRGLGGSMHM